MRRKGEKPVVKRLRAITAASPVVRMIADGDRWFRAWCFQQATPASALSRTTGIPAERLRAIELGETISRAEIDALARAWSVSAADLTSTLPDKSLVVD